jgi:hypothetical protein
LRWEGDRGVVYQTTGDRVIRRAAKIQGSIIVATGELPGSGLALQIQNGEVEMRPRIVRL